MSSQKKSKPQAATCGKRETGGLSCDGMISAVSGDVIRAAEQGSSAISCPKIPGAFGAGFCQAFGQSKALRGDSGGDGNGELGQQATEAAESPQEPQEGKQGPRDGQNGTEAAESPQGARESQQEPQQAGAAGAVDPSAEAQPGHGGRSLPGPAAEAAAQGYPQLLIGGVSQNGADHPKQADLSVSPSGKSLYDSPDKGILSLQDLNIRNSPDVPDKPSVRLDWLTVTVAEVDGETLAGMFPLDPDERPLSQPGFRLHEMRSVLGGHAERHCRPIGSSSRYGSSFECWQFRGQVAEPNRVQVSSVPGQASRVDLAWDFFGGGFRPADLVEHVEQANSDGFGSTITMQQPRRRGVVQGETLYIGTAKSERRVRIYDKLAEQESKGALLADAPESWVRVELVLRKQWARAFWDRALSSWPVAVHQASYWLEELTGLAVGPSVESSVESPGIAEIRGANRAFVRSGAGIMVLLKRAGLLSGPLVDLIEEVYSDPFMRRSEKGRKRFERLQKRLRDVSVLGEPAEVLRLLLDDAGHVLVGG